jgi:hypothetical protein
LASCWSSRAITSRNPQTQKEKPKRLGFARFIQFQVWTQENKFCQVAFCQAVGVDKPRCGLQFLCIDMNANQQFLQSLRSESKRLRARLLKIDALISDVESERAGETEKVAEQPARGTPFVLSVPRGGAEGEYSDMTQPAAIMKALAHGPQTSRELLDRLGAGGCHFKNLTYLLAVVSRMKDRLHRREDGKLELLPR